MGKRFVTFLVIVVCSLTGCGGTRGDGGPVTDIVDGNNEFAVSLFARLREQRGNLFYSPYSLSTALAMTYAGARGQTAEEMAKTLHFTAPPERLHRAFHELIARMNGGGKSRPYQLAVANALWGQKGDPVLPEFLHLLATDYGASFDQVDFRSSEDARRVINEWVEEHTQRKIKNLISAPQPLPGTSLILTNAIYFKGTWEHQFVKLATHDEPFTTGAGEKVQVPMMHQVERLAYHEGASFQMLELPYAGGDLSMVILLPKATKGLRELEESLTAKKLSDWAHALRPRRVSVSLPRFKIEGAFSLGKTLADMGMPTAFKGEADFSGINGSRDLFISDVVHKAFVDVNEEGTEAAAATGVVMTRASKAAEPITIFRADHPFLFLIRETKTGSVLFLGRAADPRG